MELLKHPHIGARVGLDDGSFLGVHEARLVEGADADAEPAPADQTLRIDGLTARLGGLELVRVQPPGGKPMDTADWLRGRSGR